MISWKYFVSVRKLNVPKWLESAGVKSYKELLPVLKSLGVEPPDAKEVSSYFVASKKETAKKVVKPTLKKEDVADKKTPSKKAAPRKKKNLGTKSDAELK